MACRISTVYLLATRYTVASMYLKRRVDAKGWLRAYLYAYNIIIII